MLLDIFCHKMTQTEKPGLTLVLGGDSPTFFFYPGIHGQFNLIPKGTNQRICWIRRAGSASPRSTKLRSLVSETRLNWAYVHLTHGSLRARA